MLKRILILAALLMFVLSCGSNRQKRIHPIIQVREQPVIGACEELDKIPVPTGVDTAVYDQLRAALREALAVRGQQKAASAPPISEANVIPDLFITEKGDGTIMLTWSYYNLGDYDQDGVVSIEDITPLAVHYGETHTSDQNNSLTAVIDGNGNGKVDIADVTPIAKNLGLEVFEYVVEAAPAKGSPYEPVKAIGFQTGLKSETQRMSFNTSLTPAPGHWYRVTPRDSTGTRGVSSNSYRSRASTWTHTWGGHSADSLNNITMDEHGNIYAAGGTGSFGDGRNDALLLKYSSEGLLLWNKVWRGELIDQIYEIAVDNQDDVYALGITYSFGAGGCDLLLIKYASDGTMLWAETWGSAGDDSANAMEISDTGDIYIAGSTDGFSTGSKVAFLLKYASDGSPLWQKTWGATNYNYGRSLDVDSFGNVLLLGSFTSETTGNMNAVLLKYSPDGALLWQKEYSHENYFSFASIETDAIGNIYLAGRMREAITWSMDAVIIKCSPSGDSIWEISWGGADHEGANSLSIDEDGNLYILGWLQNLEDDHEDIFLAELSSDSELSFQKSFGSTEYDHANELVTDDNGILYLCGIAPSAYGSWEDLSNNVSSVVFLESEIEGQPQDIVGEESMPIGEDFSADVVEDVGGGIGDALVMKVDPLWL